MKTQTAALDELLKIHFLRPETALWRALDCEIFYRETNGLKLEGGLELGCGDGTLSFVNAGGKILNWDSFLEMKNSDQYNKSGLDVHDCSPFLSIVADDSNVRLSYDLAIDLKSTLVEKALRFKKLYKTGLAQDLNLPLPKKTQYPFVYSNILYWLDDIERAFKNIYACLQNGGRAYIYVPNENFKQRNWLYYQAPHQPPQSHLNFFDRGYNSLIHHCYSRKKWEEAFTAADLKVEKHIQYKSKQVSDIWNIGTRPIANLLISMANKLNSNDREETKFEWVQYHKAFFAPLIEVELDRAYEGTSDGDFHFFILRK